MLSFRSVDRLSVEFGGGEEMAGFLCDVVALAGKPRSEKKQSLSMRIHTLRRVGPWRLLQLHIHIHVKNFVKNTLILLKN